ncbi:hypothetical protein N5P37_011753 [Trichoderma harzianum]|uniref:Cyanovirin-N domain-containing protein n=1 Tax=Trichoderma harzianum CBS 226.95 TaxID=983964 RepID=A0A2T3ZRN4_TRIHA|nr:hypothetical protein M431DRAFT_514362 [Trichoderma harzianum CBS 226.95]KAK0755697.1 hypothetical protein N5P37_011753 [Trichoderma harzianum]PKK44020.1 hypothetical protein CI102_15024 [Trichoderma harzianum]PTB47470.1 hypothetical protein M431DRAFT_514362 [Trichoderma harzianum CBS 226.95]
MKFTTAIALAMTLVGANATPTEVHDRAAQACSCSHNNDAGRWGTDGTPATAISNLCQQGGGCATGNGGGQLCISGDFGQCGCAVNFANQQQSQHGDWFLWSSITCGGMSITMTA